VSTSTEQDGIVSGTSFISEWSLYSDDVWILPSKVVTAQRNHIYWTTEHGEPAVFADPKHARLLESSKQLVRYVLLRGAVRGRIRSRTVMDFWASLRQLIKWMISLDLSAFSDLNIDLIAAYKTVVIDSGVTAEHAQRRLYPFKVLAIASAELDDCIDIPVYVLDEMLAIQHVTSYECKTAIIPDAVALPLISEALNIIERQSQLLIEMYEFDWKSRSTIRAECASLSFTEAAAFSRLRQAHEKRYAGYTLVYSDSRSVDLSKMSNLNECVLLLETACFVLLAAFVGMRVSELGSLQTGCLSTIRSERGLELLLVNGIIFKTSRVDEGSPQQWVAGWDGAGNIVRKAVSILERLRSAEGAVASGSVPNRSSAACQACTAPGTAVARRPKSRMPSGKAAGVASIGAGPLALSADTSPLRASRYTRKRSLPSPHASGLSTASAAAAVIAASIALPPSRMICKPACVAK
jgi:hypothetical protein